MRSSCVRIAAGLAAVALLDHVVPRSFAQQPPWQEIVDEFADPNQMLQRFFGEATEEDKRALERIEVSARQERRMGQAAVEAYLAELKRRKMRVVTRGKDIDYLRDLVETIHPLMTQQDRYRTITVYLVESSRCDARSFPGGTLVFFRGLLETADSEAAVVGIVGHELSHLDRGHHLLRVRQVKLAEQTFSGKTGRLSPRDLVTAGTTIARLWTRPFQPDDEAEADRDGAAWAYEAGYDPRETGELFLKLRGRNPELPIPMPTFLRSHPPPEGRHRQILSVYAKLKRTQPTAALYIGQENLRRRVARVRQVFPE
ncbi:MAG: M48 family metalloprotease [Pirellulales bacterium]|nr:M48 family metalloprotease [Pirellulales bacterium]